MIEEETKQLSVKEIIQKHRESGTLNDSSFIEEIIDAQNFYSISNVYETLNELKNNGIDLNTEFTKNIDLDSGETINFTATILSGLISSLYQENHTLYDITDVENIENLINEYNLDVDHYSVMQSLRSTQEIVNTYGIFDTLRLVKNLKNKSKKANNFDEILTTLEEEKILRFFIIFEQNEAHFQPLSYYLTNEPNAINYIDPSSKMPAIGVYLNKVLKEISSDNFLDILNLFSKYNLDFNKKYTVNIPGIGEAEVMPLTHTLLILFSERRISSINEYSPTTNQIYPVEQKLIEEITKRTEVNSETKNHIEQIFKLFFIHFTNNNYLKAKTYIKNVYSYFTKKFSFEQNYKELVLFFIKYDIITAVNLISIGNHSPKDKIDFIKQLIMSREKLVSDISLQKTLEIKELSNIIRSVSEAIEIVAELIKQQDKTSLKYVLFNLPFSTLEIIKQAFPDNEYITRLFEVAVYKVHIDSENQQRIFADIFKDELSNPTEAVLKQLKNYSNLDSEILDKIIKEYSSKNELDKFYETNPEEREYTNLLQIARQAKVTIKVSYTDAQGITHVSFIGDENSENQIEITTSFNDSSTDTTNFPFLFLNNNQNFSNAISEFDFSPNSFNQEFVMIDISLLGKATLAQ